jgi:hypothetical protein
MSVSVLSIRVGQRVLDIFGGKTICCPHRQSPQKSNICAFMSDGSGIKKFKERTLFKTPEHWATFQAWTGTAD